MTSSIKSERLARGKENCTDSGNEAAHDGPTLLLLSVTPIPRSE